MLGEVVQNGRGQQRQIVGAAVMQRIGQAGGIGEMRVVHAQALRFLVHQFGKSGLVAGNGFRQRTRGIVGGYDDQAVQQFIDRYGLAAFQK